jgi:uncharacterized protein involved in exopolysaccharide biosynthesis
VIAAEFANALAGSLVGRQAELLNVPGAVPFFELQKKRLEEEVQKAASALERFASTVPIYSIDDQRALLLKRANEMTESIASTRGSILERNAQKEVLVDQLRMLKPVVQSPFVSGIVNSLGGANIAERSGNHAERDQAEDRSYHPLLLDRAYQDTLASLFKVNVDLAGAKSLETHLRAELQTVNMELAALSSNQVEYSRLNLELRLAVTAVETFAKRTIEEQTNASLANARVSSVRIAQLANTPEHPAFPQTIIVLALGLAGGVILASAAALLPEALGWENNLENAKRCSGHTVLQAERELPL